jgi:cytochrome c nitrite reductase small subunit
MGVRRHQWVLLGTILVLMGAAFAYPLIATAHDDVGFCLSCHVMDREGQTFAASYHGQHKVATCSDCHTGSLVQKYMDGAHHVIANVTGDYPDPIKIHDDTRVVVAGQCFECHQQKSLHARQKQAKAQNCLDCHVGHDPRAVILPGSTQ